MAIKKNDETATADVAVKKPVALVQQAASDVVAEQVAAVQHTADTFEQTAAAGTKAVETTFETTMQTAERATQSATQSLVGVSAGFQKTQAEVKMKMEKAMKTAEEFVTFGQGNVEAFMKSSQIWATGLQDISKLFAATAQAQFDETVSTFKALSGVKSIKEAMDLQSTFARSSLDKAVAETTKLTDASMKLAEQALAPITARMTLAAEKFTAQQAH